MLRVTIELFPGGRQSHRRTLAMMDIGNVTDLADVSDYIVVVNEQTNSFTGAKAWSSRGHIFRHERRQSIFALVEKAAAFGRRESEKQ